MKPDQSSCDHEMRRCKHTLSQRHPSSYERDGTTLISRVVAEGEDKSSIRTHLFEIGLSNSLTPLPLNLKLSAHKRAVRGIET